MLKIINTNNSYEYPVNTKVEPSSILANWGSFKIDNLDLNSLGYHRKNAVEILKNQIGSNQKKIILNFISIVYWHNYYYANFAY